MAIDLVALASPLEPIRFPSGAEHAVKPLDAIGWKLLREVQETRDEEKATALLKQCIPTATDADLETLGLEDIGTILMYAARKIRIASEAVGNSSGGTEKKSTPDSAPPMTSSTSAPESPGGADPPSGPS